MLTFITAYFAKVLYLYVLNVIYVVPLSKPPPVPLSLLEAAAHPLQHFYPKQTKKKSSPEENTTGKPSQTKRLKRKARVLSR